MVTPAPFLQDLLVFLVILHLASWWTVQWFSVLGLLSTILRDATKYFLLMFRVHFILPVTLILARVSLTVYFGNCKMLVELGSSTYRLRMRLRAAYM